MLKILLPMLLIAATEVLKNDKMRNSKIIKFLMSDEANNTVSDFAGAYAAARLRYEIEEQQEQN